jgi:hypothetical protein
MQTKSMNDVISQLGTLGLFFAAMTGLLLGLPWLFWQVARALKWGRFHPLAKRD